MSDRRDVLLVRARRFEELVYEWMLSVGYLPGEAERYLAEINNEAVLSGSGGTVAGHSADCSSVARNGSAAQDDAEWVCATIDYLLLNDRAACLDDYVSKPTLARKAKDKVRALAAHCRHP